LKVNSETVEISADVQQLVWFELAADLRDALNGRLMGLWDATTDEAAFNALSIDKQQALLLILARLQEKEIWPLVRNITNVYGEGGVGIEFSSLPQLELTLAQRRDFTRRWANHRDTSGGFYEKSRKSAVLHFLYVNATPRRWYVHFDLFSPVHSAASAFRHVRHEFIRKTTPDWRMIKKALARGV
jgi:outer membrane receptor protein involved in Fe transport